MGFLVHGKPVKKKKKRSSRRSRKAAADPLEGWTSSTEQIQANTTEALPAVSEDSSQAAPDPVVSEEATSSDSRSYAELIPNPVRHVFLWDLDDTLIPWDSMSKGKLDGGKEFFNRWFELSKQVQAEQLFGEQLGSSQIDALDEGVDPIHHLKVFEQNAPDAECLAEALKLYPEVAKVYQESIGQPPPPEISEMLATTDSISCNWLAAGKQAMEAANKVPGSLNVIVTASKLMAALTKLMMFDLAKHFDAHHVYSSWMEGSKKDVFQLFKRRYPSAKFIAVGDGKQEKEGAQALKIPFVPISAAAGAEAAVADLGALTERFQRMH